MISATCRDGYHLCFVYCVSRMVPCRSWSVLGALKSTLAAGAEPGAAGGGAAGGDAARPAAHAAQPEPARRPGDTLLPPCSMLQRPAVPAPEA
jgi:hypothetical protein